MEKAVLNDASIGEDDIVEVEELTEDPVTHAQKAAPAVKKKPSKPTPAADGTTFIPPEIDDDVPDWKKKILIAKAEKAFKLNGPAMKKKKAHESCRDPAHSHPPSLARSPVSPMLRWRTGASARRAARKTSTLPVDACSVIKADNYVMYNQA